MYEDLDQFEPRRIQILNPDGTVYNTIIADLNFCNTALAALPPPAFPTGGGWRIEPAPPEVV